MGAILRVTGGLWAAMGFYLIWQALTGTMTNAQAGVGLVMYMVVFVLPGLGVLGIGEMLHRKGKPTQ
jgi:hypothetical protein